MSIRNNHWYNLNEQRNYPLDDLASGISDDGNRLPNTIIQDLRLRWPLQYGRYAFVSAVAVTTHLVTVMIEVATTMDNSGQNSTLIAGVTVPRSELIPGQAISFQTFRPYVGGFISFGEFESLTFSGNFSTPRQALLTARAARYVRTPPVASISVENSSTSLKGVVRFVGVAPLKLVKETRIINGVEQDNVIVLKLVQPPATVTREDTVVESVFAEFAGECGKRVGSRSCGDPQPIESINGVRPDCDGILTLSFTGCATVGRNDHDCGVIVDCNLGLSASCAPPYLPALADGKLPSEAPPLLNPPPIPPEPPIIPDASISDVVVTVLSLPYCDTFDAGVAFGFSLVGNAVFGVIGDDSPAEYFCCSGAESHYACSESTSESVSFSVSESNSVETGLKLEKRYERINTVIASSYGAIGTNAETRINISLFDNDVQTLYRKYTTDLKIITSSINSLRNAGIVANYRLLPASLTTYYLALVDIDQAKFGLYFYNGVRLAVLSELQVLALRTNDWYRVSLSLAPTPNLRQINFIAKLDGITDPTISATINSSIAASLWSGDSGKSGFYTRRSQGYFSYWRIDELIP